jgi:hypothetical protein
VRSRSSASAPRGRTPTRRRGGERARGPARALRRAVGPTLDDVDAQLGARVDALRASGAPLAAQSPRSTLPSPAWFAQISRSAAPRASRPRSRRPRAICARASRPRTSWRFDGKFDELRAHLAATEPLVAGLDAVAATSASPA